MYLITLSSVPITKSKLLGNHELFDFLVKIVDIVIEELPVHPHLLMVLVFRIIVDEQLAGFKIFKLIFRENRLASRDISTTVIKRLLHCNRHIGGDSQRLRNPK